MLKTVRKLFSVDKVTFFLSSFILVLSSLVIYATSQVHAVQVAPLPEGNLLKNPWFRSTLKPSASGLDYWVDESASGLLWSTSQKESNPTAETIVSGKCGFSYQHCGTAARFANGRGQGGGGAGKSGVDAILSQVVPADQTASFLLFKTHWVTGEIQQADIVIYGGTSDAGPWTQVWTPFFVTQENGSSYAWTETELLSYPITQAWPYYKVVLHGNYPTGTAQGVKFTGIYFAAADENGQVIVPSVTPTPPYTTLTPVPSLILTPTPTSVPGTGESTPTPSPTPTVPPVATPTPDVSNNSSPVLRTSSLSSGFANQEYNVALQGYDNNKNDILTMTGNNLPFGLSVKDCVTSTVGSQARVYCDLSGTPTQSGTYNISITLSDQFSASTTRTYNLVVK